MRASGTGTRSRPRVWSLRPLLALTAVLPFVPPAAADGTAPSKLVVVLYPQNDDGSPGHVIADRGLRAAFATGSTERIELYAEYLDIAQPRGVGDRQIQ